MIIAIDGPAGSGKSTLAKLIAKKLNILFIDTGAMYRALTLKALREGCDLDNEKSLVNLLQNTDINLIPNSQDSSLKVILDDKEVTKEIRDPEITKQVMFVARLKGVREEMVKKQRKLAEGRDAVLEGRDIGTVVFPNAEKKFYLDASLHERANRRHKDFVAAGHNLDVDNVKMEIYERDNADIKREVAPLKKAADAVYIDTTKLNIQQVCDRMLKLIKIKVARK